MHNVVISKYSALDGRTIQEFNVDEGSLVLRASKLGVEIIGNPHKPYNIEEFDDLIGLSRVIAEAYEMHRRLMTKVVVPFDLGVQPQSYE